MSKPRANNITKWIKQTRSRINTLRRSLLFFRRKRTHPVRLKTRKRNIIAELNKSLFPGRRYGNRKRIWSKGFILPTVTMILLVFSLVAGSILLRTAQNTQGTVGSRQSQITYNLANPAIERAKSKIEFLFKRDSRFPNVIPTEGYLERLMLNRQNDPDIRYYDDDAGNYLDIYTLPQETRIDIDNDNRADNAWVYETDINGDGVREIVVYSILMRNRRGTTDLSSSTQAKASALVTRNGPLSLLNGMSVANCNIPGAQDEQEEGWYAINTATVRKNFQVNAVVVRKTGQNGDLRNITSLEFQQDRQMDRGNKWGVWFRYDLEAYPGPDFNWNGAMHTDGNIIWGDTNANERGISAYLISSPASCLYTEDASELTMAQNEAREGVITFQGQVINGSPTPDNYNGFSSIDIYQQAGVAPTGSYRGATLNRSTDSVRDNLQSDSSSPYQFSLDPITVFTEDRSTSRYTSDSTNVSVRDPNWNSQNNLLDDRFINKLVRRPYLDDLYRADDRWGPKPTYNSTIAVPSGQYGQEISGQFLDELTQENPASDYPDVVGLDGYWERRARVEGLRLIVGQRLNLGNNFEWQGNNDPLYPPNSTTLANLDRQRRTLRDNLAAVQSTLVYHYQNNIDFPVATLATTVHPGTTTTRDQSTTFSHLPFSYSNPEFDSTFVPINTDFLTGIGTNGWEFKPPGNVTTQSEFAAKIENLNDPLRIALNNLALFAGDSKGAFPPVKETSGSIIHPHPDYTMWGDFSELRRILLNADGSPKTSLSYSDLSIADRTTVQTAAATIGLLAYNLDNVKRMYEAYKNDGTMKTLAGYFAKLVDGNTLNGEVNDLISPKVPFGRYPNYPNTNGYQRTYDASIDAAQFYGRFTLDQYLEAFSRMPEVTSLPAADRDELINKARKWATYLQAFNQIERDRILGFKTGPVASRTLIDAKHPSTRTTWETTFIDANTTNNGDYTFVNSQLTINSSNSNGVVLGASPLNRANAVGNGLNTSRISGSNPNPNRNVTFKTVCDPATFQSTNPSAQLTPNELAAVAVAFCSTTNLVPKYPSLYFIFPKYNHNYLGLGTGAENAFGVEDNQPYDDPSTPINELSEEYIQDSYLATDRGVGILFNVIKPTPIPNPPTGVSDNTYDADDSLAAIALQPRALANWRLPDLESSTDLRPSSSSGERVNQIIYPDNPSRNRFIRVPILDTAFYDGRQLMQVRALNVDLRMLRDNSIGTDTWLTRNGVIYAFREDAVREDAIARPSSTTFANCDTETELFSNSCRMRVSTSSPQDPPNNSTTGVSLKPVDYYADPDRRPYGFRLMNGADISRNGTIRGISFISDNPVYIQGNLNLHQNSSGTLLEEFTQTLNANWDNFYTRSTLNSNFARPATDRWRPVEILGDSLTVLSNSFCDGTFEDGMRDDNGSCAFGTSSYRNSTLASTGGTSWQREDPKAAATSLDAPIRVDRNAVIRQSNGSAFSNYRRLNDDKPRNDVDIDDTRMNAIFIGGLVPSRAKQSYGGLHNFPRFIENWQDENLHIMGAFIQLNFSTYGTAPWDHEAWEPGTNPADGEQIRFYNPPDRRWGYDVAMQYNPAGPVASRFISVGSPRNEFYQQIAADDPYTKRLRCASFNGSRIDANATDCN